MRIRVRTAVPEDLPRIVAIENLAFDHPWSTDSFLRELSLPFSRLFVICVESRPVGSGDDETIAGYLCRWLVADECHILNIAVDPARRRLGLGKRLIKHAIAEANTNQSDLVTLEVRRSNWPARGLYRQFHFEERRLRRNYYGPGEDAIVMELRLH